MNVQSAHTHQQQQEQASGSSTRIHIRCVLSFRIRDWAGENTIFRSNWMLCGGYFQCWCVLAMAMAANAAVTVSPWWRYGWVCVCVLRVYTFSKQPPSPERFPSNYVSYSVMSHAISFRFSARTELNLSFSLSSWATAVRSHLFIVRNCRITKHSEWVSFRVPSNNPCAFGPMKEAIYFPHTHSPLRSSVSRNDVATVRGRASKCVQMLYIMRRHSERMARRKCWMAHGRRYSLANDKNQFLCT